MNPEDFISIQDVISWYLYPKKSSISRKADEILKLALSLNQGNIFICDVTLKIQGYDEEKIFSHNNMIRNNIRRGNTVVINSKTKEAYWGRKGLIKFFDISERTLWAIKN